jgi:3-deoxy-7-phosphoheptulonate synthase
MTSTAEPVIADYRLFPSPQDLITEMPLPPEAAATIARSRDEARAILNGTDDRLLVITGPCSVHDPLAALDYAARLARTSLAGELLIIMRAYVEKPRTVTGWAGLISDPGMDGGHDVHRGLREARRLLAGIAALGVPAACEWVNPAIPPYLADAVTWSAIGARTTESQPRRHLASALPTPVGFKNATDGDVQPAINACLAAASPCTFLGITQAATLGLITSPGNPDCHVALRGGRSGTNFDPPSVTSALDAIEAAGLPRRVIIDASHGNSRKDHRRQPHVALAVADQVAAGERGIAGVMLESFLVAGRQEHGDPAGLVYGQSVTDACIDLATTEQALETLAGAVYVRRRRRRGSQ